MSEANIPENSDVTLQYRILCTTTRSVYSGVQPIDIIYGGHRIMIVFSVLVVMVLLCFWFNKSPDCAVKKENLFVSYFSYRKQSENITNTISESMPAKYAVSQGSILGPSLFCFL